MFKIDSVRRAMAPTQPTAPQQCFKNYFLGNKMPQGLWNTANPSLRFICQTLGTTPGIDYYATVFDDNAGIAILSAYTVTATQANNIQFKDHLVIGDRLVVSGFFTVKHNKCSRDQINTLFCQRL